MKYGLIFEPLKYKKFMLKRFSFFKTTPPKRFEFKPRFYDQEKEERERRYAQSRAEVSGDNIPSNIDDTKQRINIAFNRNKKTSNYELNNKRLVMIILIVVLFVWWVLH